MLDLAEAKRSFDEDGFLILERLFSEEEIVPFSDEINRILAGKTDYVPKDEILFEPGSTPPRVRNVFRVHLYNPLFASLATNPKLVSIGETLLGRPLRLYGSQVFAKPAEVGTVVPLHQDMPYWPFEPYEMISCWIALDASTLENGCVRFKVGSHKLGMLKHAPSQVTGNSLGLADERVAAYPERAVEVPRGSCVIHHCLTAHWSEPNRSALPRRGLILMYMSPNVVLTDASKLKQPPNFMTVST